MSRHRDETIARLARIGITSEHTRTFLRISASLHSWHEHECNGTLQRDEETGKVFWYSSYDNRKLHRAVDRETACIERAKKLAASYGLIAYIQGDPRGCALYLVSPADIPPGEQIDGYYSRGMAVVPR